MNKMNKKQRRRFPAVFQGIIVIVFLAMLWFSFGQNVLGPQEAAADIPEKLGTLELVGSYTGAEAMAQIDELHGLEISLEDAYTAVYVRGNQRATVWVGRAASRQAADELAGRMVDGIARGGSGFGNLQTLDTAGQEVFQVSGPGGEHFFYVSGRERASVVWLSVEGGDALAVLEEAVGDF